MFDEGTSRDGEGLVEPKRKNAFTFQTPVWLDEATSTSTLLKERVALAAETPNGAVLAAKRQTRGRGRMGGNWLSSRDGDLTFSFLYRCPRPPLAAATLPMACALGVRDFLALPPWRIATRCKWPNDVMAGDAKICGILTEGGAAAAGGIDMVVGIGVNVRSLPDRDSAIGRPTAAMQDFHVDVADAETLLPRLLACLEKRIDAWEQGGFAAVRGDLQSCLWGVGKSIAAKTSVGTATGTVEGLGVGGELVLLSPDGGTVKIASVAALDGW